mmetsp:Transcript_43362/g.57414  ORF Transcript_43362/g.57414 Transcript_43362/m.57414 type:complete len:269 (+) Transcript_43362:894-1700(+)
MVLCVNFLLHLSFLKSRQDLRALNELHAIDDEKADRFVAPHELAEAPCHQVKLNGVHARQNHQVCQDRVHETHLVFVDLLLGGLWAKQLCQVVLVVSFAHFFHEFAGAELPSNVDQHALQFLAFVDLFGALLLLASGSVGLRFGDCSVSRPLVLLLAIWSHHVVLGPLFGKDAGEDKIIDQLALALLIVVVNVKVVVLLQALLPQDVLVHRLVARQQVERDQRLHVVEEVLIELQMVHIPLARFLPDQVGLLLLLFHAQVRRTLLHLF